ncbi:MAG: Rne/Rng family ribonuclease [Christensenellaceae bacterium]|jgi:ribonuclease, rne/rng family|nr:Rne/Rng family ribonuclease [Clostridia bacterium]PWL97330.1 MAG: ribonuclease G [Clostridiales bacterium]
MKKEWFFDRYCGQQFVALLEDGKLAEFAAEKEKNGEIVGNIYKGRVMNVLAGMQAAFISCGLERNCYLSIEETYTDYSKYDGTMGGSGPQLPELKEGDEIIVQVTKPPRGNKGAKVTTHLSFVGKNLIFLPNTDFVGISRKITDPELRENLLFTADRMREREGEGFIVRTQAPFVTRKQLKTEAEYLKNLYRDMRDFAKGAAVGAVLYKDFDLPVRVMRDSMGDDVTAMYVGDDDLYERLLKLARLRGDISERKLIHYTGKRALMREYGISPLVFAAAQPTVPLDNGGYLVIDRTEAMTVVDVNTGSFVGDTRLEDTVFSVNLAAAREIARQVRLRNIGGIVVVDFIDMTEEAHREAVTAELTECLSKDKAKCHVLPMSELCLTQFTRKRVGCDVLSYLVKPCPHCRGNGDVPEDIFVITRIRSDILDCFANGYHAAVVELNEGILRRILGEGLLSGEVNTIWRDKRVYMIPHKTFQEAQYSVRGDNSGVLHLPDKAQILY